jgi:hypothetical protein
VIFHCLDLDIKDQSAIPNLPLEIDSTANKAMIDIMEESTVSSFEEGLTNLSIVSLCKKESQVKIYYYEKTSFK